MGSTLPEIATDASVRGAIVYSPIFLIGSARPEYVLKTYYFRVLISDGIDLFCMGTTKTLVAAYAADGCGCNRLFVYTHPRMPRGTTRSGLSVSGSCLSIQSI